MGHVVQEHAWIGKGSKAFFGKGSKGLVDKPVCCCYMGLVVGKRRRKDEKRRVDKRVVDTRMTKRVGRIVVDMKTDNYYSPCIVVVAHCCKGVVGCSCSLGGS